MKNSVLALLSLVLILFSCKKEEMPVQPGELYGVWSMVTITQIHPGDPDSLFGPDFTKDFYSEVFAQSILQFRTDDKVVLHNREDLQEEWEIGGFKLDADGRTLECWTEGEEEPEVFTVETVKPGIIAITTTDGVKMEFVRK